MGLVVFALFKHERLMPVIKKSLISKLPKSKSIISTMHCHVSLEKCTNIKQCFTTSTVNKT